MTLLQFIYSKLKEETPVGDLARDANSDSKFKKIKTDKERLEYLKYETYKVIDVYEDFLDEFNAINGK